VKQMIAANAREIYTRYIKSLPPAERLQLLAMLAQGLASEVVTADQYKRNILELHGLGREIWEGVDAQEYVNQLREEWERPTNSNEAQ
jgi:hypothetical protein